MRCPYKPIEYLEACLRGQRLPGGVRGQRIDDEDDNYTYVVQRSGLTGPMQGFVRFKYIQHSVQAQIIGDAPSAGRKYGSSTPLLIARSSLRRIRTRAAGRGTLGRAVNARSQPCSR